MVRGRDQTPEEEAEDRQKVLEHVKQPGYEEKVKANIEEASKNLKLQKQLTEIQKTYEGYVFDENEVLKDKDFIFSKINQDYAGIGLFLPKNLSVKTKTGYLSTQKNIPVIIYSNPKSKERKLLELSENFENRSFKIRIRVVPDESVFPRKWNLTNIQYYLANQEEAVSLHDIFKEIKATYKQFCSFERDTWYSIHALWDIGTYFYKLFDYYPLLELRGQMATGKTKIMSISRIFAFNPTQELTNPSESTLFREGGKTQYLDEAEKIFYKNPKSGQMEGDSRAEIINSGFKKSGSVPRQEKRGDRFITINYSTYSPRMVASINGLFGATEDRAIIHTTIPASKSDKRAELEPNESDAIYNKIRCELHVLLLEKWQEIECAYKSFENNTKLKQRDLNIWKPLLVLAKDIDLDLYEEVKEFAENLSNIKRLNKIDETSLEYWIIKISLNQLEEKGTPLVLKEISLGLPEQYSQIKSKTISKILERLGLYEVKHRTNKGFVYQISFNDLKQKVELFYPDFFSSLSSLSSLNRESELKASVKESEENRLEVKEMSLEAFEKSEASEANVESEGHLGLRG